MLILWTTFCAMSDDQILIPPERIERLILLIRGHKVIIDEDLADLYGVDTRVLNRAVQRNVERFPEDFMFQLSKEEWEILRARFTSTGWGGRRYPPFVFTEQGVAMLSSVLRSPQAVQVNIEIMRAFVRLRQLLASHEELARKLDQIEQKLGIHDQQFSAVFEAIRQLMKPPPEEDRDRIGFVSEPSVPYVTKKRTRRKRAAKK